MWSVGIRLCDGLVDVGMCDGAVDVCSYFMMPAVILDMVFIS